MYIDSKLSISLFYNYKIFVHFLAVRKAYLILFTRSLPNFLLISRSSAYLHQSILCLCKPVCSVPNCLSPWTSVCLFWQIPPALGCCWNCGPTPIRQLITGWIPFKPPNFFLKSARRIIWHDILFGQCYIQGGGAVGGICYPGLTEHK